MPVDKAGLQALVRREAVDPAEKHKLLLLAAKAELWEGLEEDEVLGVLRLALEETASGAQAPGATSAAGMLELWTQLRSLQLESDSFLTMPAAAGILLPDPPPKLFIRDSYKQLADIVLSGNRKVRKRMLVTGMSGTGKSAWLLYFMWRLAQANKTMAFQFSSDSICVVNSQSEIVVRYTTYLSMDLPKDVVALIDAQEPRLFPYGWTVLVCSANRALYEQFLKMAFKKIMPPWTLEELELARPFASMAITRAELEQRHRDWGGSVRYCLSPASESSKDQLATALQRVNVDSLFRLLEQADSTPAANQVVAHIPDANLDLAYYQMCSPYALGVVLDKVGKDSEDLLRQSIDRLADSPMAAGFRGQMFELYLLRVFLPRGGSVMVAQFDEEGNLQQFEERNIAKLRMVDLKKTGDLSNYVGLADTSESCFVPPRSYTALVAFVFPNVVMQIHTNLDHKPLSGKAIREALRVMGVDCLQPQAAVLQQWVPMDIAQDVKMVEVTGIQGGASGSRPLPLLRELVVVDFWQPPAQSGASRSSPVQPQARASTIMLRHRGTRRPSRSGCPSSNATRLDCCYVRM